MNKEVKPYDMIVLGFDQTAEETSQVLQAQGKRTLYIPIDPQMIITLMTQKQLAPIPDSTLTHINVLQNTVETSLHQTTTYFLHPEEIVPSELQSAKLNSNDEDPAVSSLGGLKERVELGVAGTLEEYEELKVKTDFVTLEIDEPSPEKQNEEQIEELSKDLSIDLSEEQQADLEREINEEQENIEIPEPGDEQPLLAKQEHSIIHEPIENTNENIDLEAMEEQRTDENISIESLTATKMEETLAQTEDVQPETTSQDNNESLTDESTETNPEVVLHTAEVDEEKVEDKKSVTPEMQIEEEKTFPFITPLAKESLLIDNRLLGIRESSYRDRLSQSGKNKESILSSYHLFNPIRITEEPPNEVDELVMQEDLETDEESIITQELQIPDDLQDDFTFNLELEQVEDEEIEEETIEENTQSLMLDRDLRLRKKFSYQNHNQNSQPITEPLNLEQIKQTNGTTESSKTPDVFPLEPFSRRRNKKSRLFSSLENPFPQQSNHTLHETNEVDEEMNFSSLIQDSLITDKEESFQPSSNDVDDTEMVEEHSEKHELETSADNLKIDTIEFEEPYGHNGFEDFFPSFSNGNDRKRQELDKIEKRKIALRGLHNLINNLG